MVLISPAMSKTLDNYMFINQEVKPFLNSLAGNVPLLIDLNFNKTIKMLIRIFIQKVN